MDRRLSRLPYGSAVVYHLMQLGFAILHEDRWILGVDKASGILSVPGIGPEKADCLAARVQARYPGARIVHRLDRDTSGVMVMARDADIHRHLSVQFQDRKVRKSYIALVGGSPVDQSGLIDLPLRKQAMGSAVQIIDPVQGRPSQTRYTVLEQLTIAGLQVTRLLLEPLTGRSHQLRVHCASIGCPILGDDLYATPQLRDVTDRLCLHAWKLDFEHPAIHEQVELEAPIPF